MVTLSIDISLRQVVSECFIYNIATITAVMIENSFFNPSLAFPDIKIIAVRTVDTIKNVVLILFFNFILQIKTRGSTFSFVSNTTFNFVVLETFELFVCLFHNEFTLFACVWLSYNLFLDQLCSGWGLSEMLTVAGVSFSFSFYVISLMIRLVAFIRKLFMLVKVLLIWSSSILRW